NPPVAGMPSRSARFRRGSRGPRVAPPDVPQLGRVEVVPHFKPRMDREPPRLPPPPAPAAAEPAGGGGGPAAGGGAVGGGRGRDGSCWSKVKRGLTGGTREALHCRLRSTRDLLPRSRVGFWDTSC